MDGLDPTATKVSGSTVPKITGGFSCPSLSVFFAPSAASIALNGRARESMLWSLPSTYACIIFELSDLHAFLEPFSPAHALRLSGSETTALSTLFQGFPSSRGTLSHLP